MSRDTGEEPLCFPLHATVFSEGRGGIVQVASVRDPKAVQGRRAVRRRTPRQSGRVERAGAKDGDIGKRHPTARWVMRFRSIRGNAPEAPRQGVPGSEQDWGRKVGTQSA